MSTRIGILHPGQMGASVGAAARAGGATVAWASAGRSDATRRRAEDAGLEELGTLSALVEACDLIVSVCPPAEAVQLAGAVAELRYGGVYVDANAVAPRTAREIGASVEAGGGRFVDGGIVGLPPTEPGQTRLYLSGPDAEVVARSFRGSLLEPIVLGAEPGAASALKVCYAAWTKGSSALLIAIRALAAAEGVEEGLLAEWGRSQAGVAERSDRAARRNAFKAWRFVGEMREIADAFEAAGLPGDFHAGAADVYGRLETFKNRHPDPELAEVLEAVLKGGG